MTTHLADLQRSSLQSSGWRSGSCISQTSLQQGPGITFAKSLVWQTGEATSGAAGDRPARAVEQVTGCLTPVPQRRRETVMLGGPWHCVTPRPCSGGNRAQSRIQIPWCRGFPLKDLLPFCQLKSRSVGSPLSKNSNLDTVCICVCVCVLNRAHVFLCIVIINSHFHIFVCLLTL